MKILTSIAVLATALGAGCGNKRSGEAGADPAAAATPGAAPAVATSGGHQAAPVEAPSRGPEHDLYDLWDNRLAAHVQRGGGLFIPAGSAGFVKYLRFGKGALPWKIRGEKDGVRVAEMGGKTAAIHVPLAAVQVAGTPSFRIRAHSGPQRLGLRINGKRQKEVTTQLEGDGWQVATIELPEGVLEAGENEILLFASAAPLAVDWIQIGGEAAPADDDASAWTVKRKRGFKLPPGGGTAHYIAVPDKSLFTADIASASCTARVVAAPHEGTAIEGVLHGAGSAVDLAPLAGHVVRLEVIAAGCDEEIVLEKPRLVTGGRPPQVRRGPAPERVIFWVIDSLRADKVKIFVPGARAEVPVLEKLAASAAVFTQAYVQGNETKASHASIWTSLYPVRHKMIPPNSKIDPKWTTIDEVAAKAGLLPSGVSGNGYITPRRGFGSAWKKYRNHIHEGGGLRAEDIIGKGLESLAGIETEKWLLYLGTIDTHVSWRAKEPWISRYDSGYSGRFTREASGKDMGLAATGKLKVSERDISRIRALYDSNVSYQDQQLGELLAWLESKGIADSTMLIITADHGDELFEVGRVGHGSSLRDSLVHVPLLIHYPPLFPAGRISEGAEVIDIVPTVADALGAEADPEWQGVSLLPLAHGVGRGYPRLSMASLYENAWVGRMGPWKLRAAGAGARLYNLATDPEEKTDVAAERPLERRMISDALWLLRAFDEEWRKSSWGNPANVSDAFATALGE